MKRKYHLYNVNFYFKFQQRDNFRLTLIEFRFSDYKAEYEKLRQEKLAEEQKSAEDRLNEIRNKTKAGTEIPMASFITEVSSGRDLTDIYLKHPANESSEDEDGTEDVIANGDVEKEEECFNQFMKEQMQKQKEKIQMSKVTEKS